MIYVSQGHEKGIGLEVFLKSFILLTSSEQDEFTLVCNKKTLEFNLISLKILYSIKSNLVFIGSSKLKVLFLPSISFTESTDSLLKCLELINPSSDLLITLPTSKDQLHYNNEMLAGHTEFFRRYFDLKSIVMVFQAPSENILLVTDHLPISQVAASISKQIIIDKISQAIVSYTQYFSPLKKIFLSGINPHCGENGILGFEDEVINEALVALKIKFSNIDFNGPFAGDTLHLFESKIDSLFVYMYHDQALSRFKSTHQFIGANISLGLPFLRISVDHGTAFELFGKNKANFSGSLFTLKLAIRSQVKMRGN